MATVKVEKTQIPVNVFKTVNNYVINLSQPEAETLFMLLRRIGGPNGAIGPVSRRIHIDGILESLRPLMNATVKRAISNTDAIDESVSASMWFNEEPDFDKPISTNTSYGKKNENNPY